MIRVSSQSICSSRATMYRKGIAVLLCIVHLGHTSGHEVFKREDFYGDSGFDGRGFNGGRFTAENYPIKSILANSYAPTSFSSYGYGGLEDFTYETFGSDFKAGRETPEMMMVMNGQPIGGGNIGRPSESGSGGSDGGGTTFEVNRDRKVSSNREAGSHSDVSSHIDDSSPRDHRDVGSHDEVSHSDVSNHGDVLSHDNVNSHSDVSTKGDFSIRPWYSGATLDLHKGVLSSGTHVTETTKPIPVHKTIRIPVPKPVAVPHPVPYLVKVSQPIPIKIPVPFPVEKTVQIPVEKIVRYPVEKPVPVKVVKKVHVPVPKPYPVPVPVYKIKYIYHTKGKYDDDDR